MGERTVSQKKVTKDVPLTIQASDLHPATVEDIHEMFPGDLTHLPPFVSPHPVRSE